MGQEIGNCDSTALPSVHLGGGSADRRGKGSFAGDVLKLVTGTGSAQIIGVLAAPLIARLFAPEAFGMVAIFASASGIVSVIVCLRYDLAIVLPEHEEDAAKVVSLCFVLVIAISSATVLLVWLAGHRIVVLAHAPTLARYLWLLPINVFFTGLMTILNGWNTRQRQFGRLTVLQVISRCCITVPQIVLGLAGFATGGVLISCALAGGSVIPAILLGVLTWRDSSQVFRGSATWENISHAFKRYSRFPKYSTSSAILGTVSSQGPVLMLSGFFSPGNAGQFSMGSRLLRAPMLLIGNNFKSAFFPRAAEARYRGTLDQRVESGFRYLAAITTFPCLLLMVMGKELLIVTLGSRWAEAGVYSQLMAVMIMFWFLCSPVNNVLLVLEEQALELRMQILIFATRILSFVAGGLLDRPWMSVGLFSLSGAVVYAFYTSVIFKKVGLPPSRMARVLLSKFIMFVPAGLILVGLKLVHVRPIVVVFAAIFMLLLYFSNVVRTDPVARRTVAGAVHRFRIPHISPALTGKD